MTALNILDQPLRTEAAPYGIVSYELAGDVATAEAILASWDGRAKLYAAFGLGLDFLFMLTYSSTIALACIWASRSARMPLVLIRTGVLLAWGQWLAAVFDAIENSALLTMLMRAPIAPWPEVATSFALAKFALISLGLTYAMGGLILFLIRSWRRSA